MTMMILSELPGPRIPDLLTTRPLRLVQNHMKIVSTFHASSSVLASVKCSLSARDLEHLVVAKLSRIDVYSLRPHGLEHECGVDVWGKICSLRVLPISVSFILQKLSYYALKLYNRAMKLVATLLP